MIPAVDLVVVAEVDKTKTGHQWRHAEPRVQYTLGDTMNVPGTFKMEFDVRNYELVQICGASGEPFELYVPEKRVLPSVLANILENAQKPLARRLYRLQERFYALVRENNELRRRLEQNEKLVDLLLKERG